MGLQSSYTISDPALEYTQVISISLYIRPFRDIAARTTPFSFGLNRAREDSFLASDSSLEKIYLVLFG